MTQQGTLKYKALRNKIIGDCKKAIPTMVGITMPRIGRTGKEREDTDLLYRKIHNMVKEKKDASLKITTLTDKICNDIRNLTDKKKYR